MPSRILRPMKGKALVQLMNVDIQAGTSLVIPETATPSQRA
jgi:hypothetical protein